MNIYLSIFFFSKELILVADFMSLFILSEKIYSMSKERKKFEIIQHRHVNVFYGKL